MERHYVPLALALAVLPAMMASGCISGGDDLLVLTDGMELDGALCASTGLDGQVTVFHSPYCPACQKTVPVLEDIENETATKFEFIDTSSDRERIYELGMAPQYIPAVIINCRIHVGYRTKAEFLELIG
jgi:thiol-disulfide isomerase/thioredoxin